MSYRVDVPRKQQRVLDALPADDRKRIARAIVALGEEPRPRGAKRLSGSPLWRMRIGSYRVMYAIWESERVVLISKILRRTTTTYD